MSSQLTLEQVASRLSNFPLDRYLYIGGFMRSVAWAAGTIVLIRILRNPTRYLPRLLPWLVSFLATMVTLMTWGRGILLTNSRANVRDSVIPTLMGIVEFCLFAILAPGEDGVLGQVPEEDRTKEWLVKHLEPLRKFLGNKSRLLRLQFLFDERMVTDFRAWHLWFFVLGIHALLAVLLIGNRIENTLIPTDFDPRLYSLANEYMQWMLADKFGATIGTVASIISGFLMLIAVHLFKSTKKTRIKICSVVLYIALFIPPIGLFCHVIKDAERQRQRADQIVFTTLAIAEAAEKAKPPCPVKR